MKWLLQYEKGEKLLKIPKMLFFSVKLHKTSFFWKSDRHQILQNLAKSLQSKMSGNKDLEIQQEFELKSNVKYEAMEEEDKEMKIDGAKYRNLKVTQEVKDVEGRVYKKIVTSRFINKNVAQFIEVWREGKQVYTSSVSNLKTEKDLDEFNEAWQKNWKDEAKTQLEADLEADKSKGEE